MFCLYTRERAPTLAPENVRQKWPAADAFSLSSNNWISLHQILPIIMKNNVKSNQFLKIEMIFLKILVLLSINCKKPNNNNMVFSSIHKRPCQNPNEFIPKNYYFLL